VKRKSLGWLKSKLRKKLQPEVDLISLRQTISEFLEKPVSKSVGDQSLANNLAVYLTQKYVFMDRKSPELRRLIERHPNDLAVFLDQTEFKEFQVLAGALTPVPQPTTIKEWAELILKIPDEHLPTKDDIPPANTKFPWGKRKPQPRLKLTRANGPDCSS
jgi:hypothetical protein